MQKSQFFQSFKYVHNWGNAYQRVFQLQWGETPRSTPKIPISQRWCLNPKILGQIPRNGITVCNQLSAYISEGNIMYKRQYAYRHCHSTEDAVLDAVDWISQNIDSGYISTIIAAVRRSTASITVSSCASWGGMESIPRGSPATWAAVVTRFAVVAISPLLSLMASHRGRLSGRSWSAFFCNDLPRHLDVEPVTYAARWRYPPAGPGEAWASKSTSS